MSPEHERQMAVKYLRGLARAYYRRADHDVARAFSAAADAIGHGEHHQGELAPAPAAVAAAVARVDAAPPPVVARPSRGLPAGVTGDTCRSCGGFMVRTGTCMTCQSCGDTSGCA